MARRRKKNFLYTRVHLREWISRTKDRPSIVLKTKKGDCYKQIGKDIYHLPALKNSWKICRQNLDRAYWTWRPITYVNKQFPVDMAILILKNMKEPGMIKSRIGIRTLHLETHEMGIRASIRINQRWMFLIMPDFLSMKDFEIFTDLLLVARSKKIKFAFSLTDRIEHTKRLRAGIIKKYGKIRCIFKKPRKNKSSEAKLALAKQEKRNESQIF